MGRHPHRICPKSLSALSEPASQCAFGEQISGKFSFVMHRSPRWTRRSWRARYFGAIGLTAPVGLAVGVIVVGSAQPTFAGTPNPPATNSTNSTNSSSPSASTSTPGSTTSTGSPTTAGSTTTAGTTSATPPATAATTTADWLNYQCAMNEPFASFAVDGTTMLWQDEPLTGEAVQTSSFRLIDVNRNSTGRFAGQPAQGPKPLKAFVISNQVGSDGATERRYPFTLEVVTPKTVIGGCARLPYRWSVRFVTGVEAMTPSMSDRFQARPAKSSRWFHRAASSGQPDEHQSHGFR
jgi:uncharacterized membrane protein